MTTTTGNDALSRYQYLLRTASPDQIEQAHEQAFAGMTEDERRQVLQALSQTSERPADATAPALARAATRLEMQQPGAVQQLLGSRTNGIGTTLLASLAAGALGSAVWGGLTGYDGVGGRPGILSRLLGGGLLGGRGMGMGGMGMGGMGMGMRGFGGGPGGFGGGFGGGPGGPGGFGGGPGGFGGGPGGPGGF